MAELFLKQGHRDRALAIYRAIVRERPQDTSAARRLAELEGATGRGENMFRELIRRIIDNVPGAIAGSIMGWDGIAIDTYQVGGSDIDIPTLLIEFAAGAQVARRAAESLAHPGPVTEVAIAAQNLTAIVRPVTNEIFLAVVLGPTALSGKARYLMRIVAPAVAKELV